MRFLGLDKLPERASSARAAGWGYGDCDMDTSCVGCIRLKEQRARLCCGRSSATLFCQEGGGSSRELSHVTRTPRAASGVTVALFAVKTNESLQTPRCCYCIAPYNVPTTRTREPRSGSQAKFDSASRCKTPARSSTTAPPTMQAGKKVGSTLSTLRRQ